MQRLQRTMGRALPQTADESQVAVLLKDFEDVDQMLDRLIAGAKAWRDAWKQILMRQQMIATEFDGLYNPIVGSSKDSTYAGPPGAETPEHVLARTMKLAREYAELEGDMKEEVDEMDLRVIRPAEEAKASIQPLKKVIKKRRDRKLDYERYQGRYDNSVKKIARSDRENRALNKHEGDVSRSKEEYVNADQKIRECLPPLLQTIFSLLPYILVAQVTIQNNLLGHCYTQISEFCQEEGFPVPAPPMPTVVQTWESQWTPVKAEVEAMKILRKGKSIHQPMRTNSYDSQPASRRPSGQTRSPSRPDVSPARSPIPSPALSDGSTPAARSPAPPSPNLSTKPSMSRVDSNNSTQGYEYARQKMLSVPDQSYLSQAMPNYASPKLGGGNGLTPDALGGMSPAGPTPDYFSRNRTPSAQLATSPPALSSPTTSMTSSTPASLASPASSISSTLAAAAALKKKRPPPPPKRTPSAQSLFVTALYDYVGQSNGDLTFREGDRIRVIKRTESTQDWWEGELAGVKGSFPANYVQVA